jgi:hypothetical protein
MSDQGSRYDPDYYDRAASALNASIAASAAPARSQIVGNPISYAGVSGSVVTPVGGIEVDAGLYSGYGQGGYLSFGTPMGIPGASLGAAWGHTQSLAGDSFNTSMGGGLWGVGASHGFSYDPNTGETVGEQWSAGLSAGFNVGASAGYSTTITTEFTSLYLVYIQFLNSVGFPSEGGAGDADF